MEEELTVKKREFEKRTRIQMENFIKETQGDRKMEEEDRKAVVEFEQSPDVDYIFQLYETSLRHLYAEEDHLLPAAHNEQPRPPARAAGLQ